MEHFIPTQMGPISQVLLPLSGHNLYSAAASGIMECFFPFPKTRRPPSLALLLLLFHVLTSSSELSMVTTFPLPPPPPPPSAAVVQFLVVDVRLIDSGRRRRDIGRFSHEVLRTNERLLLPLPPLFSRRVAVEQELQ